MARLSDPRVIIFGADGMLGTALMREAQRRGLRHHLHGKDVDITDARSVAAALAPIVGDESAVVINAAAWTHVDACEQDPDRAFVCNAWGPRTLALVCQQALRANFVHISTGAVFDGLNIDGTWSRSSTFGHDEFEPVKPVSIYAKTKWAGEELVRQTFPKALIVRLGHLYGPGGKNGLSTARKRLLSGERFSINDHCRIGPTYADDAARVILGASVAGVFGTTLHVAPQNAMTAWGFSKMMAKRLGRSEDLVQGDSLRYPRGPAALGEKILGVSGPVLAKNLAWRSNFQLIHSNVLHRHGLTPIGSWEAGLDRYLKDEASS